MTAPATQTAGTLLELGTPALVVNRRIVRANARAMGRRAASLGVRLRPHLKTAKSIDVARLAIEGHFGGVAVATLKEAEYFAGHGLDDILYAVCVTPDKLPRAARLLERGINLGLITDDATIATAVAEFARERSAAFDVYLEIDVGEHRTGVDPDSDELLEVARRLHDARPLRFRGVLGHAGQSYGCADLACVERVAEDERRIAAAAAQRLRSADIPCDQVSVGSTPTAVGARSGEGITEMRPGVYILGDLFQAAIGVCTVADIAASVLATVISHRAAGDGFVVDAGALALSHDRSTASTGHDAGFGLVADVTGALLDGLRVSAVHQEHGEVLGPSLDLSRFPLGSRVRILPNHACITAAAYERYHVVDGADPRVVDSWDRVNGWE